MNEEARAAWIKIIESDLPMAFPESRKECIPMLWDGKYSVWGALCEAYREVHPKTSRWYNDKCFDVDGELVESYLPQDTVLCWADIDPRLYVWVPTGLAYWGNLQSRMPRERDIVIKFLKKAEIMSYPKDK